MENGEKVEVKLMTPEEASDFLGISRTTLYRLVKNNRIPFVRIGRQIRIPNAGFRELIAQMTELNKANGISVNVSAPVPLESHG